MTPIGRQFRWNPDRTPAFATRIESQQRRPLPPEEIVVIQSQRETRLSRLLMLYIGTGLVFMLLPGTFLGVWNLISIDSRRVFDLPKLDPGSWSCSDLRLDRFVHSGH